MSRFAVGFTARSRCAFAGHCTAAFPSLSAVKTNRELYKSIAGLIKERKGHPVISLESYLSSLVQRAGWYADKQSLSLEEFFSLLRDSFDGPGEPVNRDAVAEFQKWKIQVERQIEDLKQMERNGQLQNKHRYFGIRAPSGGQWYNFDPCSYIECGVDGSMGGWVEGDDTDRDYVPGKVAYLAPDGSIGSCDPKDLDRPPEVIPAITWDMFLDFSWCGQNYE